MQSVMISIQPKWCSLIVNGKKTVEVRKTKPKLDTPFKVYIYCTHNGTTLKEKFKNIYTDFSGKVIGEFVCKSIANYEAELWNDETYERIQEFFEPDDFAEYGEYEYKTVADNGDDFWRENMLCTYSCLTIEELRKYIGSGINDFYGWNISDLAIYDKPKELSEFINYDRCPYGGLVDCKKCREHHCLTRPPQSWCYVERGGAG